MKFNNILFWCEFPEETNWKKISTNLKNKKIRTYIAVPSLEKFKEYKRKLSKYKNIIVEGAWPTLSFNEGYWFSSFISKKAIDKLKEFKEVKIKIDIEPPIILKENKPKLTLFHSIKFVFKYLFRQGSNKEYLENILSSLDKNKVILSSYPFPKRFLKKVGWSSKFLHYNFMLYTSFFPKWFRPLYRCWYVLTMKDFFNKKTYFAVGLLEPGIYRNEPCYKSKKELIKDIEWLYKKGVRNIVVFDIRSLENKIDWLKGLI
jgi:hypothetical protein